LGIVKAQKQFTMPIELFTQVAGPMRTNAYLLHETDSHALVIVDPSIGADSLFERARQLVSNGARFEGIWNTHGHIDHIYDNARWKAEFGAPILAHAGDSYFFEHLREQSFWFGLDAPDTVPIDSELLGGQTLQIGEEAVQIWHLPGHSPGSVAFLFNDFSLVGDVLFHQSVGRTDLPGGDSRVLADSLARLWTLPDSTRILCGHGEETTIGREKSENTLARSLLLSERSETI